MKALQIFIIAIAGLAFSAKAQKGITKSVIQTASVQCGMCKKKIENYLSHQDGIKSVTVDVIKKQTTVLWINERTTVLWINERTNIENVKTHIANIGYDADDVTADVEAYKKLPVCCKKPEEPVKN